MGDIACDAKGPVTTQGMLLSKYMQPGRCLRILAEGPWRPTLWSHTACLLLSARTTLEASSCMCTAEEQGPQDGLPAGGALGAVRMASPQGELQPAALPSPPLAGPVLGGCHLLMALPPLSTRRCGYQSAPLNRWKD